MSYGNLRLAGKVAVITGGASGIGAATVKLFAQEGARVLIADVADDAGNEVSAQVAAAGGVASFLRTDVTSEADIIAMIAAAVERYGRLDILFNNAGGGVGSSGEGETALERMSCEEWDRSHSLNLRAAFLAIKYALPHMRRVGGGAIISTGSGAGERGTRGTDAYNVHKAGLHMLTRGFAQAIGKDNIRINAIAPGLTATPLILGGFPSDAEDHILPIAQPLRRAGLPTDIAKAALFLAGDDASFITGAVLPVDGGWLAQGDQNSELTLYLSATTKPEWA